MRPQPPEHSIDGEAIFVPMDDEAWMCEETDFAKVTEDGVEYSDSHPVGRYYSGATRYRLTPEVREYLDMTKDPEMFVLCEVPWRKYAAALDMRREHFYEASIELCREGIAAVRPDAARERYKIAFRPNRGGLTAEAAETLFRLDRALVVGISVAVMAVNEGLSRAEKKP